MYTAGAYFSKGARMPIKGMTDVIRGQYPDLGKLRKGAKKTNPKKPGEDLTYFRFTSENESVVKAFTEECGTKPTALEVYLPHATTEENFSTWKEVWNGSGTMLHRCDGEKCVTWHDDDGYHNAPLGEGPPCPGECTEVGRLQVIIPALIAAGHIGTVTSETHGVHDILNISRALKQVEELCQKQGGQAARDGLRQVGFTLYRSDCEISSPEWKDEAPGKRHKVTKSLVRIVPSQQWAQAQMLAAQDAQLSLPEPGDDIEEPVGEVIEGVVEEFTDNGLNWDELLDRPDGDNEVVVATDPALKAAIAYTTQSGVVLGQTSYDELRGMLDRINNAPLAPGPETLTIKKHVELLLTTEPK